MTGYLFALAFATDVAEGIGPLERYYDEKTLRNHLLQCLRNNEINQFQQENMSAKSTPSKIVYKVYEVFAYAEMFSLRKTQRKNQKTSWQSVRNVGNGIIVNAK